VIPSLCLYNASIFEREDDALRGGAFLSSSSLSFDVSPRCVFLFLGLVGAGKKNDLGFEHYKADK